MIEFKAIKLKNYKLLQSELKSLNQGKVATGEYDEVVKLAKIAGRYVISWDFADSESGNILPIPSEVEDVLEELTLKQLAELLTSWKDSQLQVPN